jgi:hypothetical protein
MKNQNSKIANKENKSVKSLNSKKEDLKNVNLSKIEKKVTDEKKVSKDKIYKFDYQMLSSDNLKSKRQSARKKLQSFVNNIINYSDLQKDAEKLKEQIKLFKAFYKETYNFNNFEIGSLRTVVKDKEKLDLQRMLDIIKSDISKEEKKDKKKINPKIENKKEVEKLEVPADIEKEEIK